jgi:molybdopterin synthase sulfur carrier subunit
VEEKMEVHVKIPDPWKKLVGGQDIIKTKGRTVREVFQSLAETYPGLKERLLDEKGEMRHFIIQVNNEDIRCLHDLETPLDKGNQLSVILSVVPLYGGG